MKMTKDDKPILTKDGKPVNVPWSLLIGIGGLIVGLGSQLWGIAMVGAIFLGYWLLKRYPPTALAVQEVPETPTAPQPTPVVEDQPVHDRTTQWSVSRSWSASMNVAR
jgi:hypothetical protein